MIIITLTTTQLKNLIKKSVKEALIEYNKESYKNASIELKKFKPRSSQF